MENHRMLGAAEAGGGREQATDSHKSYSLPLTLNLRFLDAAYMRVIPGPHQMALLL